MATSVTLPALGESVTEGTVTRWLKQEGDTVEADEPLLEVSTDKVDTEIPSPAAGTLLSIKVREDETVEVGAELAVIGDSADDAGSGGGDSGSDDAPAEPAAAADPAPPAADMSDGRAASGTANTSPEATAGEASPEPQSASRDGGDSGGGESGGGDSVSVTLPALGESVTEGTVTRWLKQEGDTVEEDEPLVEVSTDKVDTEIPSPAAGTLLSITVQEDETVEVGAQLAVIGSPSAGGTSASAGGGSGAATAGDISTSSEDAGDLSGGELAKTADDDVPADEKPAFIEEKALADKQAADIEASDSSTAPADRSGGQGGSGSGAPSAQAAAPNAGLPSDASAPSAPAGSNVPAQTSTAGSRAPAPSKTPAVGVSGTQAASNGAGESSGDGAYVTPLVRKLASEAGVDLGSIQGTGVGGRIRKQDVTAAADAKKAAESKAAADAAAAASAPAQATPAQATPAQAAPAEGKPASAAVAPSASASLRGQTVKMTRMRAFIAKRMVESLQVSAQLTTVVEVDVTQIARLRKAAQAGFTAREGVKLSFLPFFAKAAIEALRAYPQVNSSINSETNEVTYHGAEHLGIAVDTERGLIVPVIHDAGDLNIGGLARKIADLAERTRDNKISPDELSGGTFTLTNTGSRGALFDTPILNQPQVGILGTGAVVKRPVVIDDPRLGETIVVRSMVYLALTYDHRIVDGADAARFLTSMKQRLEEGQFETELGL